jgi:lipid-binding SYLF domain-containing protein
MIVKTNTGAWSAPCFVTLNRLSIGAVVGVETTHMLMAGFTRQGVEELAGGKKHQTFGSDITFQFWPFSSTESGPDDYASLDVNSDWVIAAVGKGLLFDFSLSGSSLSVDNAKNKEVYGEEDPAGIIYGTKVSHSQSEMVPLYHKITEIAKRALY